MLNNLVKICEDAGKIIKDNFYHVNDVDKKGDIDLVTNIDIEVEKFVLEKLNRFYPDVGVVAEESSENNTSESGNIFYLDPIDGTTNFVHGFPFVSVSLAYYEEGAGKHGVVYNPVLGELFTASAGEGAFCNGKAINVSDTKNLINSLIGTGFPYTIVEDGGSLVLERFANIIKNSRGIRRAGSAALDLCYTAKGVFDGYYESGLKSWDVAAGKIILEESGGKVSAVDGSEYQLEQSWIVGSNSSIHKQLLDVINR